MKRITHLILAVFLSIASISGWAASRTKVPIKKPPKQTTVVQAVKTDPVVSAPSSPAPEPTLQMTETGPQVQASVTFDPLQILNQVAAGANGVFTFLLPAGANEWSIFPIVKVLYPTGERPLVVVVFKCPTEAAFNISTPPMKVLHFVVSAGMDAVNATNALPFKLEQLCS